MMEPTELCPCMPCHANDMDQVGHLAFTLLGCFPSNMSPFAGSENLASALPCLARSGGSGEENGGRHALRTRSSTRLTQSLKARPDRTQESKPGIEPERAEAEEDGRSGFQGARESTRESTRDSSPSGPYLSVGSDAVTTIRSRRGLWGMFRNRRGPGTPLERASTGRPTDQSPGRRDRPTMSKGGMNWCEAGIQHWCGRRTLATPFR